MLLEDIPEVQIDNTGIFKFIQMKGPNDRNYLFGHKGVFAHFELYRYFKMYIGENSTHKRKFKCVGGGRINIDEKRKVIRADGRSERYGKFDADIVKFLLKKYIENNLSGFLVEIE